MFITDQTNVASSSNELALAYTFRPFPQWAALCLSHGGYRLRVSSHITPVDYKFLRQTLACTQSNSESVRTARFDMKHRSSERCIIICESARSQLDCCTSISAGPLGCSTCKAVIKPSADRGESINTGSCMADCKPILNYLNSSTVESVCTLQCKYFCIEIERRVGGWRICKITARINTTLNWINQSIKLLLL